MARGLDALGAEIAERLELPAGTAGLVKLTLMGRSRDACQRGECRKNRLFHSFTSFGRLSFLKICQ